ncbi:MAG: plastocyanin/azurin family copper-binding protein [Solirubrobacteraceae bacterium]
MHLNRRILSLGVAGGAALLAPAAAGAAVTKTVYAGPPPGVNQVAGRILPNPKGFVKKYNPDINAFFNQRTTINVGDSVSFVLHGFHTVDIPAKGGTDQALIMPSGGLVSGANDAAGKPFWFNGKVPNLGFNPALFARTGGKVYNGSSRVDTGLPLGPKTKPMKVKFAKAGTYKFFCDVHPGMIGYVVVKPKGKAIPSATQDAAAQTAQATTAVKQAKKLLTVKQPANTVSLGEATPAGTELFAMFPASLTVKAGTTVTFRMSAKSRETHTATFGSVSYLKPLAKSFQGGPTISPIAAFPSDPTQPITESTSAHGNGFANTGTLDNDPLTPLGASSKIDFTTPGTYHFVCLIHPFMHGTIIVK